MVPIYEAHLFRDFGSQGYIRLALGLRFNSFGNHLYNVKNTISTQNGELIKQLRSRNFVVQFNFFLQVDRSGIHSLIEFENRDTRLLIPLKD